MKDTLAILEKLTVEQSLHVGREHTLPSLILGEVLERSTVGRSRVAVQQWQVSLQSNQLEETSETYLTSCL